MKGGHKVLDRTPVVFISYSWTSKEYQQRVIELASRMRHDGVDVKLDVWDLNPGQDKYKFMEQCVTDPEIDRVLILIDKLYAEKADKRTGGVGDETAIISANVYGNAAQQKFIPVIMERDENGKEYLPAYLKSRMYRDLTGSNYEEEYEEILRIIFDAPTHRKPEIGEPPTWLVDETPDGLYAVKKAAKVITANDLSKMKSVAARDFIDLYIEAMKQFFVRNIDKDTYIANFRAMKEYRDVFLDHLKAFAAVEHFGSLMADEFERLYNSLYNIKTFDPEARSYSSDDVDLFNVHVWELFICTVAFMLHFEMYRDINELLVHTYYLRTDAFGSGEYAISYEGLRFHSRMMEERIKPQMEGDLSRKYTLIGHYIVSERAYEPIYSANNIANADLFLYQVYNGLELDDLTQRYVWFPTLYVYANEQGSIWKRLVSKKHCEKIMPIFGVTSIEELKDRLSGCKPDREIHYSGDWPGSASAILNWIKVEDVATLP